MGADDNRTNSAAGPGSRGCGGDRSSLIACAAGALLNECAGLVGRVDDAAYRRASAVMAGGTIGKHVRHVLDHFAAAVGCMGTRGDREGGVIDYDHRERDVPMETDRLAALEAIGALRGVVESMGVEADDLPVVVRVMLSGDGATAETRSTLGRELAFAAHHAVHHHAMIKVIAAEFGVEMDGEFGKAPSTVNFERGGGGERAHACAR